MALEFLHWDHGEANSLLSQFPHPLAHAYMPEYGTHFPMSQYRRGIALDERDIPLQEHHRRTYI